EIRVQAPSLGRRIDCTHPLQRLPDPLARERQLLELTCAVSCQLEAVESAVDLARRGDEAALSTVDSVEVGVDRVATLVRVARAAAAREEDRSGDQHAAVSESHRVT